jgi:MIP family channel proteins
MEVVLPFIQESLEQQGFLKNKATTNSAANQRRRSSSSSIVNKTCCDYHTTSGQYIIRCPPNRAKTTGLEDRFLYLSQIQTLAFYQALLSEFIGTMILTLVCTSTGLPIGSKSVPDLHGALVAGFVVATLVVNFGHMSGAHINPAVTISFLVACEIDFVRAFCYIGMQLLGGISGSCLLRALTAENFQGNLGLNTITRGVSIWQAILVESIITFVLCYTVHAICDKRREDIGGSKALAVGLAVIVGCLFGGPYTSASMNPARSFGPAVVLNAWDNHWVYWCGPLLGSITAAILYSYILRQQPPILVRNDSRSRSVISKAKFLEKL